MWAKSISWRGWLALFLAVIPVAVLGIYIQQHVVNLPWGEGWVAAGRIVIPSYDGKLQLSALFSQIAEHRPFTAFAIILLIWPLSRWNMQFYPVVTILLTLTFVTLVILLLRRQSKQAVKFVLVPLSLICFAISLSALWFRGYFDQLFPPICLTASLLILSTRPVGWPNLPVLVVLGLLSLFSTLHGAIVWLVIPIALWIYGYRRIEYYLMWTLTFIVSLALYFQGWETSTLTKWVIPDSLDRIALIAGGALNVLGSTFANLTLTANLIAVAGIGLTVFNLVTLRKRADALTFVAPWIVMIIYAFLAAGAISLGRVGQGLDYMFKKSHYMLVANMFWIGAIVLGVHACLSASSPRWRAWLWNSIVAAVCVVSYLQINIQAASTFQPQGMEPYGPSHEDELCVRAYVINGDQSCYKWGYWLGTPGHPIRTYDLAARRLTTFASLDNIHATLPSAYQSGDLIVVNAPLAAQQVPLVDPAGKPIPDTMIFRILKADQRELYYLPLPYFAVGTDLSSDILFRDFIKQARRLWYLVAFTPTETGYWYDSLLQREYKVIDLSLSGEEKRLLIYPGITLYSKK